MKYLLLFALGFCFHKVTEEVFMYSLTAHFKSEVCVKVYIDAMNDKYESAPFSKRINCAKSNMGYAAYLEYLLIRPHLSDPSPKWYY